jgi:hypothetical protein
MLTEVLQIAQSNSTNSTTATNNSIIFPLSTDDEFSFELLDAISHSNGKGANTAEVLRAASQIVAGDYESFYEAFFYLANQIHDQATSVDSKKYRVSAREAYFRASTYYREAVTFLVGNQSDPRLYSVWNSGLADYNSAIDLLDIPAEQYNLTGSGFEIPVIFYKPSLSNKPRPTFVVCT